MPRLADPQFAPDCTIVVDGDRVPARAGESVVSALLAAGRPLLGRSSKYHRPRGAFCLAGSCASCLMRVDGVPNVRACRAPCRDGLAVETQNALGSAAHDLLGAIDLLAPDGIDHHHLATWSQLANKIAVGASRQLAGLGQLPDRTPAPWPPAREERFDALVVGAGPAGLGAAESLARAGRRVLLAERERAAGGRLRCRLELPGDPPLRWAREVEAALGRAGGEVATAAAVLGVWPAHGEWQAAVVQGDERLRLARAPRLVLACGTWPLPPVFEGNDLPGIHGARGLAVALAEDGVVPGQRAAVLGDGTEAEGVARRLAGAGMAVERIAGGVARSRGRLRLTGLELESGRSVECDTLAVATARAPASELAREAGAALALDPETGAWWVRPGEAGAIAPGAFAAGELSGPCSAAEAAEAGRRAGEAAARG
ncbi:MAG TPA: 2Fe-2S iron-sulfur cluster-binding protein [Anaeromyxobacteraceae bacterium]|nr:2Fe-2S iron-sulfur cluster-binding protein [Anaeromyxobacteraceae bacterium]